ncbi:MAG: hypothetical protein N3G77_07700 [Nitrososphaeria archaeon]|nr:hypothetical protein [Nitrososphaeria archaeon]
MILLKIIFETRSPAIVTKRTTRRGYSIPLNYIPPSMLRGALISSLYMKDIFSKNHLEKEKVSPTITVSPAYPMDEREESYPAHPFIYKCKIPHGEDTQMYGGVYNDGRELLKNVKEGLPVRFRQICDLGHIALENLHPRLLIPFKESFREVKLHTLQSINVGISKHRATSHRGMLFEYEAIAQGVSFWSNISIPDELAEIFKPGFEFSIGRGISRGFGRAVIRDIKKINIDEEAENFERILKDNRKIVFYALSNLLSVQMDNTTSTYPTQIELRPVGERFNITVNGNITIEEVYGKTSTLHTGWDIMKNEERPSMRSVSQGSIVIGRVSGNGEVSRALVILSRIGTVEYGLDFTVIGVNTLIPLEIHPMVG